MYNSTRHQPRNRPFIPLLTFLPTLLILRPTRPGILLILNRQSAHLPHRAFSREDLESEWSVKPAIKPSPLGMKTGGSSVRAGGWPTLCRGLVLSSTTEGKRKPFMDRGMTESSDDEEPRRLGLRGLLKRSLETAEKKMVEAREVRPWSSGDDGDWAGNMVGVMMGSGSG